MDELRGNGQHGTCEPICPVYICDLSPSLFLSRELSTCVVKNRANAYFMVLTYDAKGAIINKNLTLLGFLFVF